MTGPRFTEDLAQKERRRDYNVMSLSSRLRAKELEANAKSIASEKSQTQVFFRRRKEELLSSIRTRAKQLEKLTLNQHRTESESCQLLKIGSPRSTDPYPVSFGKVTQKSRADELLEQYHGRRRRSYEFEDAPIRRNVHQYIRARRMSKEFEDLPPMRANVGHLTQRRKSREYEDIRLGAHASPLLSRRRKSKEFEDITLRFERPPSRRQFFVTAENRLPSGRYQKDAIVPAAPTSPKSTKSSPFRSKHRPTYPIDKVTTGFAQFTTVHSRDMGTKSGERADYDRRSATFTKDDDLVEIVVTATEIL